jgi:hypothetical protein
MPRAEQKVEVNFCKLIKLNVRIVNLLKPASIFIYLNKPQAVQ